MQTGQLSINVNGLVPKKEKTSCHSLTMDNTTRQRACAKQDAANHHTRNYEQDQLHGRMQKFPQYSSSMQEVAMEVHSRGHCLLRNRPVIPVWSR